MRRFIFTAVGFACLAALPNSAVSQAQQSRLWLLWEQNHIDPSACLANGVCGLRRDYVSRLLEQSDHDRAAAVVGQVEKSSLSRNIPLDHPEAPQCGLTPGFANSSIIAPEPEDELDVEALPLAAKIDTLRGLTGVYFDLMKAKGPDKEDDSFGRNLHKIVAEKLTAAGIKVLTKEELEKTPGKPIFKASFSPTRAEGCWWRVSAGLTQTLLLSRDQMIKIRGSTWGASGGYSAKDNDQTEWSALMGVVDRFVADWIKANTTLPENEANAKK